MKMDEMTGNGFDPDTAPCAGILEVLPLWIREPGRSVYPLEAEDGVLSAGTIEAHMATCASCSGEADFLVALDAARPEPPADLAARIVARALTEDAPASTRLRTRRPGVLPLRSGAWGRPRASGSRWWTTTSAAAAVLVTALGVGLVSRGVAPPEEDGFLAYMEETAEGWWASDWFVAGAPYLEGVSDETLAVLAAEIQP